MSFSSPFAGHHKEACKYIKIPRETLEVQVSLVKLPFQGVLIVKQKKMVSLLENY